jgi:hypothetical protein
LQQFCSSIAAVLQQYACSIAACLGNKRIHIYIYIYIFIRSSAMFLGSSCSSLFH